jgi:hypothetical protein
VNRTRIVPELGRRLSGLPVIEAPPRDPPRDAADGVVHADRLAGCAVNTAQFTRAVARPTSLLHHYEGVESLYGGNQHAGRTVVENDE